MRVLAGGRREPARRPGLTSADARQTSDDVVDAKSTVSDDVEQDDELVVEQESMSAATTDDDRMRAARVREQTSHAQTGSPTATTGGGALQVSGAGLASDGGSRSPHRLQAAVEDEDVSDGGGRYREAASRSMDVVTSSFSFDRHRRQRTSGWRSASRTTTDSSSSGSFIVDSFPFRSLFPSPSTSCWCSPGIDETLPPSSERARQRLGPPKTRRTALMRELPKPLEAGESAVWSAMVSRRGRATGGGDGLASSCRCTVVVALSLTIKS